jgi:predicted nucleic acid-binding Zn ribbon protein
MTRRRRSPRTLEMAMEQVRDELAPDTLLAEVQRIWGDAVGQAIAVEARPTAERGGALTVSCSAAVWAQELDLMAPVILQRLNERLGGGKLTRLRCVTLPLQ